MTYAAAKHHTLRCASNETTPPSRTVGNDHCVSSALENMQQRWRWESGGFGTHLQETSPWGGVRIARARGSVRGFLLSTALLLLAGLIGAANAALIDNPDGSITDTDLGVMWAADGNLPLVLGLAPIGVYAADGLLDFDQANAFIVVLNSTGYLGYRNWRLPVGIDTAVSRIGGELYHLYFDELRDPPDSGLDHVDLPSISPFTSIKQYTYWTGTRSAFDGLVNIFNFQDGTNMRTGGSVNYVLPVRDIEGVPEPSSIALLALGLASIALSRRKHA